MVELSYIATAGYWGYVRVLEHASDKFSAGGSIHEKPLAEEVWPLVILLHTRCGTSPLDPRSPQCQHLRGGTINCPVVGGTNDLYQRPRRHDGALYKDTPHQGYRGYPA